MVVLTIEDGFGCGYGGREWGGVFYAYDRLLDYTLRKASLRHSSKSLTRNNAYVLTNDDSNITRDLSQEWVNVTRCDLELIIPL